MKHILRLISIAAVLSLALFAQSGSMVLTGSCLHGGNPYYPQCISGEITFSVTNVAAQTHVKINNTNGDSIDDGLYTPDAATQTLTFIENFSFGDTYTIKVGEGVNAQTYTVTTN
jgi:hypothetical protein